MTTKTNTTMKTANVTKAKDMTREQLMKKYKTKSAAIRALYAENVSTADIAKKVGVIYQHAYNVIKAHLVKQEQAKEQKKG